MWCRWQCACLAAPDSFAGQSHFCCVVAVFCVLQPVTNGDYDAVDEASEIVLFQSYETAGADGMVCVVWDFCFCFAACVHVRRYKRQGALAGHNQSDCYWMPCRLACLEGAVVQYSRC